MIITLLTDFGLADAYVAAMKVVILGINPQVTLVDISHSLPPQDVRGAAFLLHTSHAFFPPGTIHLTVVDPGVGTERRPIALVSPKATFIAPDNGLLSYIIGEKKTKSTPFSTLVETKLPSGLKAFHLNNQKYWRYPVSRTFHGRDIFAPVAAHASMGIPLDKLGEPIHSIHAFPIPHPQPQPDGSLLGHIQHIDAFGNLISDVQEGDLPPGNLIIDIAGQRIEGLSTSYAEGGDLLAIIGSSGYLEIAARNGSAARSLAARVGNRVWIKRAA